MTISNKEVLAGLVACSLWFALSLCTETAVAEKPPTIKSGPVLTLPVTIADGALEQCVVLRAKGLPDKIRCGYIARAKKCVYVVEANLLCGTTCRWEVVAKECLEPEPRGEMDI